MDENLYKRENGIDLTDEQSIISCRNEQSRDIIENARLGSYDKFGNYFIIPEIKNELIALPKLLYHKQKQEQQTVYEIKGLIPIFGELFFKLVVKKDEVSLLIVETVKREAGGYLEIFEELIDNLALGKNISLTEDELFKNYHIYKDEDDVNEDEYYFDIENVLLRKVYLSLLSKELSDIILPYEKECFDEMVAVLKEGGEYGKRILAKFLARLNDRPEIFQVSNPDVYNKAVCEVLLSALDMSTSENDKQKEEIRKVFNKVLEIRNKSIEKHLVEANAKVDSQYVKKVVKKAIAQFVEDAESEDEELGSFYDLLSKKKKNKEKHIVPPAPILKQHSQEKKEDKKTDEQKKEEKKEDKKAEVKRVKPSVKQTKKAKAPAKKKDKPKKKAKGKDNPKAKAKGKDKPKEKQNFDYTELEQINDYVVTYDENFTLAQKLFDKTVASEKKTAEKKKANINNTTFNIGTFGSKPTPVEEVEKEQSKTLASSDILSQFKDYAQQQYDQKVQSADTENTSTQNEHTPVQDR